ncbi:MAG: AsmA-like C-terminal region-containing protein [Comamonadaceae bacterium]|nr:AsmA-like C-terminal region-containing protein [Comamonadaceae bacterium]
MDAATVRASRIDAIGIDGLALVLPRAALAELRGNIDLDPATGRARVSLADEGGRLRAEISPAPRGCRFAASGGGWHPPQIPGVTLDALKATGTVDDKFLRLERFDARTSDGLIVGSGSLGWEPRATLDLRFELQHLDLAKLLAALGVPPSARGELDATLHLSGSASQLSLLPTALAGGGPVTVSRGSIERFDLVEAARNPGTDRVHGGALRFEELKAQFQIDRGTAALRNLRLSAGALTADGSLSIRRDAALGGSLNAHLKGAAGEIRVPLRVAGTVAAPEVGASGKHPSATPLPRRNNKFRPIPDQRDL